MALLASVAKTEAAKCNGVWNKSCQSLGYAGSTGGNCGNSCTPDICCEGSGDGNLSDKCTSGWNTAVCRLLGYDSYNGGDTVCPGGVCTPDVCCDYDDIFTGTGDMGGTGF